MMVFGIIILASRERDGRCCRIKRGLMEEEQRG